MIIELTVGVSVGLSIKAFGGNHSLWTLPNSSERAIPRRFIFLRWICRFHAASGGLCAAGKLWELEILRRMCRSCTNNILVLGFVFLLMRHLFRFFLSLPYIFIVDPACSATNIGHLLQLLEQFIVSKVINSI